MIGLLSPAGASSGVIDQLVFIADTGQPKTSGKSEVMGKLEDKVAFITGVARGQGRSHAVLLAQEGCDIIGVDICKQIDTVQYPMSTPEDLSETVRLVEAAGRRIVAVETDVRDYDALQVALGQGLEEFGKLDIVLANAGTMNHDLPGYDEKSSRQAWHDAIDTMLTGVWNTLQVSVPHLIEQGRGGSIVITSSTAGIRVSVPGIQGGSDGYYASKHGVIGLMRDYAVTLAEHNIRVNTVHPTGVATPMVVNDFFPKFAEAWIPPGRSMNLLPVPLIEPIDVSRAILFLVSDDGRYITGLEMKVDAGATLRG